MARTVVSLALLVAAALAVAGCGATGVDKPPGGAGFGPSMHRVGPDVGALDPGQVRSVIPGRPF